MTSLMSSPGPQISHNFQLLFPRRYFSQSIDQMLKMSEMVMAILLVYSTLDITSGKFFYLDLKMAASLKMTIHHNFKFTSDMRKSSQIMSENVFFTVMTSSMTSQADLKIYFNK